jgi:Cu(I)/Ag(I) efflux system periplasmic protein CusF
MKRITLTAGVLSAALTLTACGQKAETEARGPAADPAASTAASPAPPATTDSMAGMNMAAADAAKTAQGSGTVTAVDAGTITVDHGAIPEANWPAMTMAFKAAPALTQSVKPGDKVAFDLKLQDGGGEITAIRKQ